MLSPLQMTAETSPPIRFLVRSLLCIAFPLSGLACKKAPVASPPQSEAPSPAMESGVLVIHYPGAGEDKFSVDEARFNLSQSDEGIWEFVINVTTDKALARSKHLEMIDDPQPNFEATALLKPDNLALPAGKIITQPKGYDPKRKEILSNFYYFSHESVEDLKVSILDSEADWIEAEVEGKVRLKGEARIELRTKFQRDPSLKRGIQ